MMQQLDERILEHFHEEGWSTPAMIIADQRYREINASEARVRERCREMTERELVEPDHANMYEITTWGLAYLRGGGTWTLRCFDGSR
jgi:repressor of nif and glnA expression